MSFNLLEPNDLLCSVNSVIYSANLKTDYDSQNKTKKKELSCSIFSYITIKTPGGDLEAILEVEASIWPETNDRHSIV